jgi:hypothetical protein
MRVISVAAAFALLASAAFAQTPGSNTIPPPAVSGGAPEVGSPLLPATDTGLDKVASDGVSKETVRAVPCKKAARNTDGTTTCVGLPGPVRSVRGSDFQEGTTTGMSRP